MKKVITIDRSKIHDLGGFYNEVDDKLTKDLGFRIGRSLNAYLDVLYGGF